jgi:hypothetical protein
MPYGFAAEYAAPSPATVGQTAPIHLSPVLGDEDNRGRAPAGAELAKLSRPFPAGHNPTASAGSTGAPVTATAGEP